MKYYKAKNNETYAYEDNVSKEFLEAKIKELGLVRLTKEEEEALFAPKEADKRLEALHELEKEIKEQEGLIRNALLIGNDRVLPELREEYKTLLVQKQALERRSNEKESKEM